MSALQTPRIIWLALTVTQGLYLVVIQTSQHEHGPQPPLVVPLAILAVVVGAASIVLPRYLFATGLKRLGLAVTDAPVPGESGGYRSTSPTARRFADPARAKQRALGLFQTAFILGLALSNAVGLFGVVIAILGFPVANWAPFLAASTLLLVTKFPREVDIYRPLEAAYDVRLEP